MSNMPEMAKRETIMFRYIRRFHEQFLNRLQNDSKETLRCAAWQIDAYLEEHGKFKDAEFLITLLHTIEYVIQKKCNTNWTVARAKKDLRGRTRGINQWADKNAPKKRRPPVSIDLSKTIEKRLIEAIPTRSD
jgi:hypothetical protein